jgi:adenosylmethionine-8-amino-7-oxononanoate aminotransferase
MRGGGARHRPAPRRAPSARSCIDGLAGLWNVNLGHGREELVADRRTKARFDPDLRVGARLMRHAQAAGLILGARGGVITLAPAFVIPEPEIDEVVAIVRIAIERTMGEVG